MPSGSNTRKLTREQVVEIKIRLKTETPKVIQKDYPFVQVTTINKILVGDTWASVKV